MSKTNKKEKHTLHRASKEYAAHKKCVAVGRIKQNGGTYICPCCIHRCTGSSYDFRKFKKVSRRLIRRTYIIVIDEE